METTQDDPRNFHSCDLCSYGSKSLLVILNHIRKHHSSRKVFQFDCELGPLELYECEYCGFETELMVNLNDHVNIVHKETEIKYDMRHILMSYSCRKCYFQAHSLLVLMKHVHTCKRKISQCRKNYESATTLKQNSRKADTLRIIGNEEWYQCDQCSYQIKHKGNLKRHVLTKHSAPEKMKWFQCKLCLYKAKRKCHLDKHMLSKHTNAEDVEWLECEHCGMKTKHQNTLKSHILTKHSNGKDIRWFKCAQCAFKTKYKFNLKEHITGRHTPSSKEFRRFKREHC